MSEPSGDQQGENAAVGEFELGVGYQVLVDDSSEAEAVEQGMNQGKGSKVDDFLVEGRSEPGERHSFSADSERGVEVASSELHMSLCGSRQAVRIKCVSELTVTGHGA